MKHKFKLGQVVKTGYGKGVVVERTADRTYNVAIASAKDAYWCDEYEMTATTAEPYATRIERRKHPDGYNDYTFIMARKGRKIIVHAGCRTYFSVKDAKAHWSQDISEWEHDNDFERDALNRASLKIIARLNKKLEA